MRYEDVQHEQVTIQLGGGLGQMRGVVVGGDGLSIHLDVEEDDKTVRYMIPKGQIIWMRREG